MTDKTQVTDGKSFFDKFCQGPPNATDSLPTPTPSSAKNVTGTPTPSVMPIPTGYPSPLFAQSSLAFHGYYLNDSKYDDVAVLAIPSFDPQNTEDPEGDPAIEGVRETQKLLREFFKKTTADGKSKLVIDLRGNGGGTISLGFEVFKQLFPTVEPYGGSRYRANYALKIYSAGLADIAANKSIEVLDDEVWESATQNDLLWSNIKNENGTAFKSFLDYWGPDVINNDTFVSIRRYNFSNTHGGHTLSPGFNLTGYAPEPTPAQPFKPENIVILSDGLCGSTCAIFAELMREQGNVHTIMVGGRPKNTPAQAVGGSKGSQVLPFDTLYDLMGQTLNSTRLFYGDKVADMLNSSMIGILANPTQLLKRTAHYTEETIAGAVNSLNNLRANDTSETPLEFIYEAADCRIFQTFESFFSPVSLWERAVDVKWGEGKCVDGSMGDESAISVVRGVPFNAKVKGNASASDPEEFTGAAVGGVRVGMWSVAAVAVAVAAVVL